MHWQIEEFVFNEKQQNLTSTELVQQLEPMVVELLAYFCRHTNQIVSRDQLIEHVWAGRVITDNAVSKVVTKLRKNLNDDAKRPKFIATFPKKGYKFVASVSPLNELKTDESPIHSKENTAPLDLKPHEESLLEPAKKFINHNFLITCFILLSVFTTAIVWQLTHNEPETFTQVKALTRDPGRESKPQVSPNGQYIAYVEFRDKKMYQWIKDLNSQNSIEVSHGEANNIWVDSVSWSSDGSKIVYLVTNATSCRYFIREFKTMKLGEPSLLHNCVSGSYGKIAYTHDDNKIVFSENEGRNTAFSLFEMNLTTGVKRKLNQPALFLGGNSQFDLHPNQNKLLISSPDRQIWEGFYALDLDTDELKLLFKQDAFICCGRWSHNGERVVLMGEHPANQLVSFDLTGNDKRIIYTGSEQVSVPERHPNGKDYLFPVVLLNQNVNYFNFETATSTITALSSVDDRLATFAHHNSQLLAYISLSTGTEEVWLTDTEGKHQQKLTNFNDSRHYIDLLWSYNGDKLLGVTLNEIHLINHKTGYAQTLKIPQVEIRGVSWKNNHTVSYSVKNKNNWHVQYYDIETHQVKGELADWQYIRYNEQISDTLWQDISNKLYYGAKPIEVTDNELLQAGLRIGRTFNLKKSGSKWAWNERVNDKYQLMIKNSNELKAKEILTSDSFHFDISSHGILFQTQEFLASDIYQTVSNH